MNLVGGDRRPPKQRQSYMCESAVLRRSSSPVFSLHQPIICGRGAKCNVIPLVIHAHSAECAGPGDETFEVVNVRSLHIRSRRLIVTAIFVEPWNRVRFSATICRFQGALVLLTGGPSHN